MSVTRWTAIAVVVIAGWGCTGDVEETGPSCASEPLRTCVAAYSDAIAACYATGDGPCTADDTALTAALDDLAADLGDCTVLALDADATRDRLQAACASEATSLASRTYGGPHGAVWTEAGENNRACLVGAQQASVDLIADQLAAVESCRDQGDCSGLGVTREERVADARRQVETGCASFPLADLVAMEPAEYVARADHQADCLLATFTDDPELGLECGGSYAQFEAARGEWVEITVDGDEWGTQCGDGSPYVFQVRLAPEGEPIDRVVVGMQGGGACFFAEDCGAVQRNSPGLFTASDDTPPVTGIFSDDPSVSPFANWTKVFLPYCTQDVFGGGGVAEVLGDLTVQRYGSVNVRASLQMVRDVMWQQLDQTETGYRPDQVVALFGGWSAGGFGTLYNYHWVLDDLQWAHTAAFPDAALALDNGSVFGVSGVGLLKVPDWNMAANLPPYCFSGECAVAPTMYEATAPRLRAVPEQQLLIVSNPLDEVQEQTQFFGDDRAGFLNEQRASTCETKDLNGIQYYLTSVADRSVHVVSVVPELWTGEVDGESMRDWFERAIEEPDTLEDRIEEGDFVELIEGVEPYPCEVAP